MTEVGAGGFMRSAFSSLVMLLSMECVLSGCAMTGWLSSSPHPHDAPPKEQSALEERLLSDGERPNGQVDHFAVLIGANTELRHRGNLSMAYQVLVEQGYDARNI